MVYGQVLSDKEYYKAYEKYGDKFEAKMGAEAVRQLLEDIDLEELSKELRIKLKDASGQKKIKVVRAIVVAEAFIKSGNRPEWMILSVIPVIPPDLRPMVQLGRW